VGLFASIPRLEAPVEWLQPIPGTVPSPLDLPAGCLFRNRCPHVLPVCGTAEPPVLEIAPGHHVACYLYEAGGRA
jgi:oligopeptide/dipeptide ABC transporter ATP-binding protein